jgi:hypothetical protein
LLIRSANGTRKSRKLWANWMATGCKAAAADDEGSERGGGGCGRVEDGSAGGGGDEITLK